MKIAMITPLPPQKTGIARYSEHLLTCLQQGLKNISLDVYIDGFDHTIPAERRATSLLTHSDLRQKYDRFICHIGNNPTFHQTAYFLIHHHPTTVVLHDTVLYFLIAGINQGELWQHLYSMYGEAALSHLDMIVANSPDGDLLRFPQPELYPCLSAVLQHSQQLVVHSQMAKSMLLKAGYSKKIHVIPLLDYASVSPAIPISSAQFDNTDLAHVFSQRTERLIIGLFGFAGTTKRANQLFEAISLLSEQHRSQLQIIIVGTDLYQADAEQFLLGDRVSHIGYASDQDYAQAMQQCDLIVNLRYPSMGETSAVQIEAMSAKRCTLITDYGWFAELPDGVALKIPYGETEVSKIKETIELLLEQPDILTQVSEAASTYIEQHHNQAQISLHWQKILLASPHNLKE